MLLWRTVGQAYLKLIFFQKGGDAPHPSRLYLGQVDAP